MTGFTIPNKSETYPFQSRIFQSDLDILAAAAGSKFGVLLDQCFVSETSPTPDMSVTVDTGQVVISGDLITVPGGVVGLEDADLLLPRFDLIVAHLDGSCTALTGEPDAAPFPLSPIANSVALSQVFVPVNDIAIVDDQIVDKRIFVPSPIAPSEWTMLGCVSELARTNNALMTDDPILQFHMGANAKYRIRGHILLLPATAYSGSPNANFGFNGPAAPVIFQGSLLLSSPLFGSSLGPTRMYNWPYQNGVGINPGAPSPAWANVCNIVFDIIFHNGPNSGTFAFQWAQQAASAGSSTIRYAGSYMEYEVV